MASMYYPIDPTQDARLNRDFTYHPPIGDQAERYEAIRFEAKALVMKLLHLTPPSREQSIAMTRIEEAVFWANAAIARNETASGMKPEA